MMPSPVTIERVLQAGGGMTLPASKVPTEALARYANLAREGKARLTIDIRGSDISPSVMIDIARAGGGAVSFEGLFDA
ncbi:MAG TPA: hypothetical protein VGU69_02745 [Rhizomicrobium sp.]|nr:hypothetical protein [Rhizomicrobium sp.]